MDIERLRALEKKWRDESVSGFDGDGNLSDTWTAQAMRSCADELETLIAELGQEVGAEQAPAWFYVRTPGADYDYTFTKTREEAIDLQDCDDPDEPIPLYTSPAHTSEARDAARYRWLRDTPRIQTFICGFAGHSRISGVYADVEIDAAMRQEGGNG